MEKLIIIGAGGHGKVCAEIAKDMNKWNDICFLDDSFPTAKKCLDFNIIGTTKDTRLFSDADFFVAIGDNEVRGKYIDSLTELGLTIVTLVHPTACVSSYSTIGVGTSIHQFSVVNTDTKIGRGCIINTSTIIEHENIISDFVHISPNVSLGGQVKIGKYSWIGIGTTIKNNINIKEKILIGAGSLVIKDIVNKGIYIGIN